MRTFRTIALGLCTALLLTIGLATPAQAAYSDCQAHELCTYWYVDYLNPHYDYSGLVGCIEIGGSWDNQISSAYNRRDARIVFWTNHNCGGSQLTLDPGQSYNTYWAGDWRNNTFSSIAFYI
jgi:hypothetical protein